MTAKEEYMDRLLSLRDRVSKIAVAGLLQIIIPLRQWPAAAWLLASVVLHTPAAVSQIVTQSIVPPPPEHIIVDQNSVDVTRATVSFSVPELSIGIRCRV